MNNYFRIDGYWKEDKSKFRGYLIKEYWDVTSDNETVFLYRNEKELKDAIKLGENTKSDFVITTYTKIDRPINKRKT